MKKRQILLLSSIGIVLIVGLVVFIVKMTTNLWVLNRDKTVLEEVTAISDVYVSQYTGEIIQYDILNLRKVKPELIAKLQKETDDKIVEKDEEYVFDLEAYYEENYKGADDRLGVYSESEDVPLEEAINEGWLKEDEILNAGDLSEEDLKEVEEIERLAQEQQDKWYKMQKGEYEERIKFTSDGRAYVELQDFNFYGGYDMFNYKGFAISIERSMIPYTREEIAKALNYQFIFDKVLKDDNFISVSYTSINNKVKLNIKWRVEKGDVLDVQTNFTVIQ